MDNKLYEYSPITARPKLTWPNGARVAFYVGVNIEHFEVDKPSTSIFGGTAMLAPDPLNYGWRDYAVRVGIWRMIEALDKYKMRASCSSIPTSARITLKSSKRASNGIGFGAPTARTIPTSKPA